MVFSNRFFFSNDFVLYIFTKFQCKLYYFCILSSLSKIWRKYDKFNKNNKYNKYNKNNKNNKDNEINKYLHIPVVGFPTL